MLRFRTLQLVYFFIILLMSFMSARVFGQAANTVGDNTQDNATSAPTSTMPSAVAAPSASSSTNTNSNVAGPTTGVSPAAGATATPSVVDNGDGTQEIIQTVYCPQPTDLLKKGLYWGTATGGWKSYSESFDQTIVSFVGAQWVGVNVGKMICIYKGNLSMSFTIPVQNDTLAQTPVGGLWGKDQGGYRNCHSLNVTDCPFVVKTQTVNMQTIYQSLDFFKGKPNPLNQNGT